MNSIITIRHQTSLSGFVGIVAHEQQHETDFWEVIWEGRGYRREEDRDRDGLRDDWERLQVMQDGEYGPWTYDIPAYNGKEANAGTDAAQDFHVTFESNVRVRSWSDARADVAAAEAVNANLAIDARDWSDLRVDAGVVHIFADEDRSEDFPQETQRSLPTTHGNHKLHHGARE